MVQSGTAKAAGRTTIEERAAVATLRSFGGLSAIALALIGAMLPVTGCASAGRAIAMNGDQLAPRLADTAIEAQSRLGIDDASQILENLGSLRQSGDEIVYGYAIDDVTGRLTSKWASEAEAFCATWRRSLVSSAGSSDWDRIVNAMPSQRARRFAISIASLGQSEQFDPQLATDFANSLCTTLG